MYCVAPLHSSQSAKEVSEYRLSQIWVTYCVETGGEHVAHSMGDPSWFHSPWMQFLVIYSSSKHEPQAVQTVLAFALQTADVYCPDGQLTQNCSTASV